MFTLYSRLLSQHLGQLSASMCGLGVVVASDVLPVDKNVGDAALPRHVGQFVLDGGPVSHLVQFVDGHLDSEFSKELLGGGAVTVEKRT